MPNDAPRAPTAVTGPKTPAAAAAGDLHVLCAGATDVTQLGNVVVGWLEAHGFPLPSIYIELAGHLRLVAVRGYWQVLDGFALDTGVVAGTFRTGNPRLISNVHADPNYIAAIPGVFAEFCVPLRHHARPVGALNVEMPRSLTLDDLSTVHYAAACFEYRLDELGGPEPESPWQRLARLSAALGQLTDPAAITRFAVEAACEITGFDSAVLVVEQDGEHRVWAAHGVLERELSALPAEVLPVIASWTDSATSVYTLGSIAGSGFVGHEPLRDIGITSLSCATLPSNGARHGFLLVASPDAAELDYDRVQHLEILAAHTISSLHTALTVQKLGEKAAQDSLTGLGHGATFHLDLTSTLAVAQSPTAVLLVDLDDFKSVNDTHGHAVGDRVLVETSHALTAVLRATDRLYRIGGDEFAAIVSVTEPAEAVALARRINEAARRAGQARVSIGVTVVAAGATPSADAVLAEADFALYETKNRGRDGATLYVPELREAARERAQLATDLQGAVDRGEMVLEYQPIVDLSGAGVLGVEALVRWQHPTRGVIPPLEFIALAEQLGLVAGIGAWVLDTACGQLSSWAGAGWARDDMKVAINVSAAELGPEYVELVEQALGRHSVSASRLVLEVTESVFVDEFGATETLTALRQLGVRVAIDDFGTGFSSLSYLSRLPIDILKIDRAFVAQLDDPRMLAVARSIVQLGRTLGLSMVAEGVEQSPQIAQLVALGCEHAQGFLWSRAVPAAEVPGVCAGLTQAAVLSPA